MEPSRAIEHDRFPGRGRSPSCGRCRASEEDRQLEGWAVTYRDTPNFSGRISVPGAFSDSLKRRPTTGKPLPMGYEHSSLPGHEPVGGWGAAEDSAEGVQARRRRDLRHDAGPRRAILVDDGVITGLSVGFLPIEAKHGCAGEEHEFKTPFGSARTSSRRTGRVLRHSRAS